MNNFEKFLTSFNQAISGDNFNTQDLINSKGFGSHTKHILSPDFNIKYPILKEISEKLEISETQLLREMRKATLTSYFTPDYLIDSIVEGLKLSNSQGLDILEPSSGSGRFLKGLSNNGRNNVDAIEINPISSKLGSVVYNDKNINHINSSFENFETEKKYDLIISNIPFGDIPVNYPKYRNTEKMQFTKNIDSFYFVKSLDHVKEDGLIVFLASSALMDGPRHELREHLVQNADLITAIRYDNDTFKEEGTKAVTDLIVLKKNSQKKKLSLEEELFIKTASVRMNFEKGQVIGTVNQYYRIMKQNSVLGELDYGVFHNRPTITLKRNLEVNEIADFTRSNLEKSTQLNLALNTKEIKSTNDPKEIFINQITDSINKSKRDINTFYKILKEKGIEFNIVYRFKSNSVKNVLFTGLNTSNMHLSSSVQNLLSINANDFIQKHFNGQKLAETLKRKREVATRVNNDLFAEKIARDTLSKPQQLGLFDTPSPKTKASKPIERPETASNEAPSNEAPKEPVKNKVNTKFDVTEKLIHHYDELIVAIDKGLDSDKIRNTLKSQITQYESLFGKLSSKENEAFFADNFQDKVYNLVTLSVDSDICNPKQKFKITNAKQAYNLSMSKHAKINLNFISQHWNDKNKDEIKQELLEEGLAYIDLDNPDELVDYKTHLSGNIRIKIEKVNSLLKDQTNLSPFIIEHLNESNKRLLSILPKELAIEDISINLGATWVDRTIYEEFIQEVFGVSANVGYIKELDKYTFKMSNSDQADLDRTWKVKTYSFSNVLEKAFSQTYPTVTYTDRDGKKHVDAESTRKLQLKIDQVQSMWTQFYKNSAFGHHKLAAHYNRLYNSTVEKKYDDFDLEFDKVHSFNPHKHQFEGSFRIIDQEGGILDHSVGSGKSLTMAMSAHEMKRLNKIRKPMIIGLKANYQALADCYKEAYPNARILAPSESDFSASNRKKMINTIRNNEYDIIILTHEQFGKIPQPYDIQREIIGEELEELEKEMDDIRSKGIKISKAAEKGLIKRKMSLELQLENLAVNMEKDKGIPTFDQLGIDHLFIDESQQFKNLPFKTKHQGVSGLGNPLGSQRAFNLLIACRSLQKYHKADKGITFASGTTISNSLTEMHAILKYLRPKKLEELKISSFDNFLKVFANKTIDYELTITGGIRKKERFRSFCNVPELVSIYKEITDVRNKHNLSIDKPVLLTKLVSVKATEEQAEFNNKLIELAKSTSIGPIRDILQDILGKPIPAGYKDAKMLIATNLAKQMSLDMKLINEEKYAHTVSPKLQEAADNVAKHFFQGKEYKGTQFVFCDTGTPSKDKKYSVYGEFKRLLIKRGVPEDQIMFVHDYKTKTKKAKFNKYLNSGEKRIALGSTITMGTGVNAQERCMAMHHLDIPWRPSDIEQQNGRGERQGNWVSKKYFDNTITSYFYATERTLDAYQYELLNTKQQLINQIKDNSIAVRQISESDDEGLDFAEYVAALTGNDDLLKLTKAEGKYAEYKSQERAFNSSIQDMNFELQRLEDDLKVTERTLKHFKSEKDLFDRMFPEGLPEKLPLELKNKELNVNHSFDKTQQYGEELIKLAKELKNNPNLKDGYYTVQSYAGYELRLSKEQFIENNLAYASIGTSFHSKHTNLTYDRTPVYSDMSELSIGTKFRRNLNNITTRYSENIAKAAEIKLSIKTLKENIEKQPKVFPHMEKLIKLKDEIEEIRIRLDGGEEESKKNENKLSNSTTTQKMSH